MELFIIVTKKCNFRCRYCYEQKGSIAAKMSFADVKMALDFFLPHLGKSGAVRFFGGEPLLEADLLKKSISYVRRKDKRIKISVNTNGSLMDKKLLLFFVKNRVDLILSFDGGPDTQDANRPHADAKLSSYGIITGKDSFKHLSRYPFLQVNAVISMGRVAHLSQDVFHLAGLGFSRINLDAERERFWPDSKLDLLKKELVKVNTFALKNRSSLKLGHLENYFEKRGTKKRKEVICPQKNRVALMPGGKIYPCNAILTIKSGNETTDLPFLYIKAIKSGKISYAEFLKMKDGLYAQSLALFGQENSGLSLCDAINADHLKKDLKKISENELKKNRIFTESISRVLDKKLSGRR